MLILGLQKTTLLDYPGKVASTIFTGGCNFKCPYCHNRDLVMPPADVLAYSKDEIFDHLNKKKKILDGVCITGGEPTLHKDLPDFISEIKDLGLLVKLDTNHSKAKYNSIANMIKFDLSAIEESVSFLKENSVEYEFRTTIMKECHTEDDIIEIGKWISGASAYYLQSYRESEQVINPIFSPHSPETLKHFVEILKPFVHNTFLRGID